MSRSVMGVKGELVVVYVFFLIVQNIVNFFKINKNTKLQKKETYNDWKHSTLFKIDTIEVNRINIELNCISFITDDFSNIDTIELN